LKAIKGLKYIFIKKTIFTNTKVISSIKTLSIKWR